MELFKNIPSKIKQLTKSERRIIDKIKNGEGTDFRTGILENDDPNNAVNWNDDRTIRSSFLEWIICELSLIELTKKPINELALYGILVKGTVNLSYTEVSIPLKIIDSVLSAGIKINNSKMRSLNLSGSHVGSIMASNAIFDGSILLLNGFKSNKSINIVGSKIGESFNCEGSKLNNINGFAINASRIRVNDSFNISNSHINGGIYLINANIGGNLSIISSKIFQDDDVAINADGINVDNRVFLRQGLKVRGEVRFHSANIGNHIDLNGTDLSNEFGHALRLDHATIGGSLILSRGFSAKGQVSMAGVKLKGGLFCNKSEFSANDNIAINAYGLNTESLITFSRSQVSGMINLVSCKVRGQLDFSGAKLTGNSHIALNAYGCEIANSVFLRDGFYSIGEVRFYGAKIDGDFDCNNAHFRGFKPNSVSFRACYSTINGNLIWKSMKTSPEGFVDFRGMHVYELHDDAKSWPQNNRLYLDGFTYNRLGSDAPTDPQIRIKWLMKQPEFRPQPFEQLFQVFKSMGYHRNSIKIIIQKQRILRRQKGISVFSKYSSYLLDKVAGYGYKPIRPIIGLFLLVLIGTFVFWKAREIKVICPAKAITDIRGQVQGNIKEPFDPPPSYPSFSPLIYSVETLVPIADFHQKNYWEIRGGTKYSLLFNVYQYLHIILGWILSLLVALSPTRIIRRE